jgi:hypothetical protein
VAASKGSLDTPLAETIGSFLSIQSLAPPVDGTADIANFTGLSNLAFTADLASRFLHGILEIVN